jgi:tRNA pseudouridine32 synthase / 23S rRNA pseudouridine746 synthase
MRYACCSEDEDEVDVCKSKARMISRPCKTSALVSRDDGKTYVAVWVDGTKYTENIEEVKVEGRFRVIYEDEDIFVIEKPSYLSTTNTRTLKDSVRSRLETLLSNQKQRENLRLQHRLDWETSGIMVAAKHVDAARSLATQFENRTVKKVYVADVVGTVPSNSGTISIPLSMDPLRRPLQRVDFTKTGKKSKTTWYVQRKKDNAFRLVLKPETGRRHQLRVHCLCMGVTIAGDRLYERKCDEKTLNRPSRLHLHAAELCFVHPVTRARLRFCSPPPFSFDIAWKWACSSSSSSSSTSCSMHSTSTISTH